MTMSVGVGEKTPLQHLIGARFDSGHQVGWRECRLFNFSEVIVRVAVQSELTDRNQRKIFLRPDFCDVEWIILVLLGLLKSHDLKVQVPRWELSLGDGVVQVANRVIWIRPGEVVSGRNWQVLNALSGLEVELAVVSFAFVVDQLEGMRTVTVPKCAIEISLFLELLFCQSYPFIWRKPSGIPRSPNKNMT